MTSTSAEIVAVYRWFSWGHLLLALLLFAIATAGVALLPGIVGAVVAVAFTALATYVGLVTLLNRTTIRVTRTALETRHGPMPLVGRDALDAFGFWPDVHDADVPAAQLLYVAKGARDMIDVTADDGDAPAKVYLKAVLHDGAGAADVQLLPSTAPGDVEDFIGWALDAWLLRAGLPFYRGAVEEPPPA